MTDATSTTVRLPHFEHLALRIAADLLTSRGHDRTSRVDWEEAQTAAGPITLYTALRLASTMVPAGGPVEGESVMCPANCATQTSPTGLMVYQVYETYHKPQWTDLTLACTGCVVCPVHKESGDVLGMFNNSLRCGCVPCWEHDFMHPMHMASDYSLEEFLEFWECEVDVDSDLVIATLRQAADPQRARPRR